MVRCVRHIHFLLLLYRECFCDRMRSSLSCVRQNRFLSSVWNAEKVPETVSVYQCAFRTLLLAEWKEYLTVLQMYASIFNSKHCLSLFCLFRRCLIDFASSHFNPIKLLAVAVTIAAFGHSNHLKLRQICQILFDFAHEIENSCRIRESFFRFDSVLSPFHSSARWVCKCVFADHTFYFCPFQASN